MNSTAGPATGETQRRLFGDDWQQPTPPRAPTPPTGKAPTSQDAAEKAKPHFGKRQRQALALIIGRGTHGATIEEVSAGCQWLLQSTCPVVNALWRAGAIVDSGERRRTRTNNLAKVWVAT